MHYQNKNEWYIIPKYPKYEINHNGDIRNRKTNRILKGSLTPDGYKINMLRGEDNQSHFIKVHRLVAEMFLPNPNNYTIVNHIDGNRSNCNVNNLEWATSKQNATVGNVKENMASSRNILINEYSGDGSYIRTWVSVLAVATYYQTVPSNIQRSLTNGSMSCGHFFRRWNGNNDPINVENIKVRKPKIDYETLGEIDPSFLFPTNNLTSIIDEIRQRESEDYVSLSQAKKDMAFLEIYVTQLENFLTKQHD